MAKCHLRHMEEAARQRAEGSTERLIPLAMRLAHEERVARGRGALPPLPSESVLPPLPELPA